MVFLNITDDDNMAAKKFLCELDSSLAYHPVPTSGKLSVNNIVDAYFCKQNIRLQAFPQDALDYCLPFPNLCMITWTLSLKRIKVINMLITLIKQQTMHENCERVSLGECERWDTLTNKKSVQNGEKKFLMSNFRLRCFLR